MTHGPRKLGKTNLFRSTAGVGLLWIKKTKWYFLGRDPPHTTIGEATVLAIIFLGIVFWLLMPILERGFGIFRPFITTCGIMTFHVLPIWLG